MEKKQVMCLRNVSLTGLDYSGGDVKRIKDKSKGKVGGEKYCIESQDHKCRTTPEKEKDIKQRPNSVRHPNLFINED